MKPTEYRSKVIELLGEIRDAILAFKPEEQDPPPEPRPRYLEPTIDSLRAALEAWDNPNKLNYLSVLTPICAEFRDWLAANYANVERVNDQWERHRYREPDAMRHADAIVIVRERSNPSRDIIVDFCQGSKGDGRLVDKLQALWHEGPYDWWVDNAFVVEG